MFIKKFVLKNRINNPVNFYVYNDIHKVFILRQKIIEIEKPTFINLEIKMT
jgi:hypothetical protein